MGDEQIDLGRRNFLRLFISKESDTKQGSQNKGYSPLTVKQDEDLNDQKIVEIKQETYQERMLKLNEEMLKCQKEASKDARTMKLLAGLGIAAPFAITAFQLITTSDQDGKSEGNHGEPQKEAEIDDRVVATIVALTGLDKQRETILVQGTLKYKVLGFRKRKRCLKLFCTNRDLTLTISIFVYYPIKIKISKAFLYTQTPTTILTSDTSEEDISKHIKQDNKLVKLSVNMSLCEEEKFWVVLYGYDYLGNFIRFRSKKIPGSRVRG